MKKIFILLILTFILQLPLLALEENTVMPDNTSLQTYSENGKFGLKDSKGNIVVNADFKKLIRIGNTAWLVQKGLKFGLMDSNGNYLVSPKYRHADRVFTKYVKLGNDNDYGLYDETGNAIIEPKYSSIEPLFNNLFLTRKSYRYGVVNNQGQVLLNNVFEDIYMPEPNVMRIKSDGEWFEVEKITKSEIELPITMENVRVNDGIKITHLVSTTSAASGYSVVLATDYALKLFSSISPAYEQTIDELMLSQGAETVNIFIKLGWLPKFPFVYAKKYYQNMRNPYNGPLTDVKSGLKKKI